MKCVHTTAINLHCHWCLHEQFYDQIFTCWHAGEEQLFQVHCVLKVSSGFSGATVSDNKRPPRRRQLQPYADPFS